MWEFLGARHPLCDRISRRTWLRIGGLAPLGLQLPQLLASTTEPQSAATHSAATHSRSFGRAKRCLMLYLWGGPSHIDMYDLKPNAPDGIRGEFQPVASNVVGMQFCEHLPHFSRHADKIALVRSVTHQDNNHSTSAHWMMTGHRHRLSAENFGASDADFPHIGSVVSKLAPGPQTVPTFVALPERIATTAGAITPGQGGGFLGKRYDPFLIDQHPDEPNFQVPSLRLPADTPVARVQARRNLLAAVDAARYQLAEADEVSAMGAYYQQGLDLITSPAARQAFDLQSEDPRLRDRYGRQTFGQSLLLSRRLLEAGVKLVTVYWHRDMPGTDTTWDTHGRNFIQLKDRLLPQVDQPLATLFEDLQSRGLLDETLIVWTSEFGRTPRINGNSGGRDHWGACNSIWFAGAGIQGGTIHGASDRIAAYPDRDPVDPGDVAATIYHQLGLSGETLIHDRQNRPLPISPGRPLHEIFV